MTVTTPAAEVLLDDPPRPFTAELTALTDRADPVAILRLRLDARTPARPGPFALRLRAPLVRTHLQWTPAAHLDRALAPDWRPDELVAGGTTHPPVLSLLDSAGRNRLTLAWSDTTAVTRLTAGVVEEDDTVTVGVHWSGEDLGAVQRYEAELRLDARDVHFAQALDDVAAWWDAAAPAPGPPDAARQPMYSTWYGFHQRLSPGAVEQQCRLAHELGMDAVIVDDGWQTEDTARGYAHCGDWRPAPGKLPDMAGHVARVHELGLQYVLWVALPFVGRGTDAHTRFARQVLGPRGTGDWFALDPRFPEVRDHLVGVLRRLMADHEVDGFKLDFLDTFRADATEGDPTATGRDHTSVAAATDQLLAEAVAGLRALRDAPLIELRQSYTGPAMRRHGTMLRAADVPLDVTGNRVRTIDLRLLARGTPVHADMVTWHPDDAVESAAMQLVHTLFAVPQVSVLLDAIPESHRRMLRFLLGFWRTHRDVLLDGALHPQDPGLLYPAAVARGDGTAVAAAYGRALPTVDGAVPPRLLLVNGAFAPGAAVHLEQPGGRRRLTVRDCTGATLIDRGHDLAAGAHWIDVPPAGIAELVADG